MRAPEASLYEVLLGRDFAALPPAIAALHRRDGRCARGRFQVSYSSPLAAVLAPLVLGLPREADAAAIVLKVVPDIAGEWWRRTFDGRELKSRQEASGGALVETFGVVECIFELRASSAELRYEQRAARVHVFGVTMPLPRMFTPVVAAAERVAEEEGVGVEVTICIPLLGALRYNGVIRLENVAA